MADRYYDDRERYRDPNRERVWGRRRDDRGEFLRDDRDNRDWNNQFDRGDRVDDYDRDRWREPRFGGERSEYGHATRDEWRWQDQGRFTGQNLGGGMSSYSGYRRDRDDRYREQADAYGLGSYGGEDYRTPGRGRFVGRGPKGYQRTDERIREDICERLTQHPDIDASDVEIQVNNGEVTLHGSVEDRYQKHIAEDVVEGISGVRDVHNQIRVSRSVGQRVSEALGFNRDREHDERRTLNVTGANPAYTEPTRK